MRLAIACVVTAGSILSAQSAPREDFAEYLPPGNGKTLVNARCSSCHDLNGMIQLRQSKQAWEAIVLDMVARGAPLMVEEADLTIEYLSAAFGPSAPPLIDVNTADKSELLKLPGMTPERADRLLSHRSAKGLLPSRDDVRSVLGLDDAAFAKMKWYLKVSH